MSVALVIQHAKRMRSIILTSVACPAVPYFSTLSHKRQEVTEDWRRLGLYSEEVHNSYSSQNGIRVIKSRRMRLVGQVARMEKDEKVHTGFC
jgi:hypothetical protein